MLTCDVAVVPAVHLVVKLLTQRVIVLQLASVLDQLVLRELFESRAARNSQQYRDHVKRPHC